MFLDMDVSNFDYRSDCPSDLQLGPLLYKRWNRGSNFLIGINYTKAKGDLWTSLSLKLNVKKKLQGPLKLVRSRVQIEEVSFLQIPFWITEFLSLADFPVSAIPQKKEGNDFSMVYVCDNELSFSSFMKLFCICVFKNMSLYIYDQSKFESLGQELPLLPLSKSQCDGKLYVCFEEELLQLMEKRS